MKIFREQWNGMGLALDLGLVKGDTEMAGAVWRNLLGARGARGIVLPSVQGTGNEKVFRRSINPTGEIEKYGKMDEQALEAEELKDDGSGVHDFGPDESDQYVPYPETMVTLISYTRRELVRLEGLSDETVLGAMKIGTERQGVDKMRFGPVKGSGI
jgi:cytochrome b pre-mRNA-processing protein 3